MCFRYLRDGGQFSIKNLKTDCDSIRLKLICELPGENHLIATDESEDLGTNTDWQFLCMSMEKHTEITRFYKGGKEISRDTPQFGKMKFFKNHGSLFIGRRYDENNDENQPPVENEIDGSVAFFQVCIGPRLMEEDGTIQLAMD